MSHYPNNDPWAFAQQPPPQQQPLPLQQQQQQQGAYNAYAPPPGVFRSAQPPPPAAATSSSSTNYYGWTNTNTSSFGTSPNPFPPPSAPPAVGGGASSSIPFAAVYDPFAMSPNPNNVSYGAYDPSGLYPTPARTSTTTMGNNNNDPFGRPADPFGSPFQARDPFAAYPDTSSFMNRSTASNNPFDVTNDDAGFFSGTSSTTLARQQQHQQQQQMKRGAPPPPAATTAQQMQPPSAQQQRLMRVASMLFERGLLIKGDKMFTQDLVLQGNNRVRGALESAERDGNVVPLEQALATVRGRAQDAADSGDSDNEAPATSGRPSLQSKTSLTFKDNNNRSGAARRRGGGADSDDEGEDIVAIDARRESFRIPATASGSAPEAPHPAAGGLTLSLPPGMTMVRDQFVGNILIRVSSKKMFRKWKAVYFVMDKQRLVIWNDRRESELGGSAPRRVFALHECMWIAKPTLKRTYSLIDDGRRVYFTTLKENPADVVSEAVASGMERPTVFTPALESRVAAKFGSHIAGEISAFAHALYGVVLHHQREAKAYQGKQRQQQQQSRYGS